MQTDRIGESVWFCTVRLVPAVGADPLGTGFFFMESGEIYIITAKHVICAVHRERNPQSLSLFLHNDLNNLRLNRDVRVPLYSQIGKPLWLEHSTKEGLDLVVIPLEKEILSGFQFSYLTRFNYFHGAMIGMGEQVMTLGYPENFYDTDNNLPVARYGATASAYPIGFCAQNYFMIDSILRPGNSGGPVFSLSRNSISHFPAIQDTRISLGAVDYYFLGIVFYVVPDVVLQPDPNRPYALN